jgi:hypothetical protein
MKSIELVKIEGDWRDSQYIATAEVEGIKFEIETGIFDEFGLLDFQYIVTKVSDFLEVKGYEVYALNFMGVNFY